MEMPSGIDIQVVRGASLEALLFDRNTLGWDFQRKCHDAVGELVRHAIELYPRLRESAELVLLSKGILYSLSGTMGREHAVDVPVNIVASRRAVVTSESAIIEIPYTRIDAPSRTLCLGDTVASGDTVCSALGEYLLRRDLEQVFVFSLAGTLVGADKIARFCADQGIDVNFIYGLAAFGLGENGFDLSFLHPATICDDEYKRRAESLYGGRPVSAVGWDFGSQYMAPEKYRNLCWVEAEMWGLHGSDVFACEVEPSDWAVVGAEADAYRQRLPHLPVSR